MVAQVRKLLSQSRPLQFLEFHEHCLTVFPRDLAANMRVHLHRLTPEYHTNDEGRLQGGPALNGGTEFTVGTYIFTFFAADYFASRGTFFSGTPFLDEIPIRFGIDNPDDHYHVPLLVSPWSFSTYRGS